MPPSRRPPTNVVVFQWPWCAPARSHSPREGEQIAFVGERRRFQRSGKADPALEASAASAAASSAIEACGVSRMAEERRL